MDLQPRIFEAMKAAMKDRQPVRVAAIRLIRDALQKAEISSAKTLDDAGVIAVLARLVKQREESIEAFAKGGRQDLVDREQQELAIIREFMPQALSREEVMALVAQAITEASALGPSDLGKVMKALKGKYEGRAAGKDLSDEVKTQLQAKAGA